MNKKEVEKKDVGNVENVNKNSNNELIKILERIDIKTKDRQVVQVLGENELVFEEGQFFLEETRNPQSRKKLSRNAAKELLLDFAIKYRFNKKKTDTVRE